MSKPAFDTNLLRPMHDGLCKFLGVDWIESDKDWEIAVKIPGQHRNGDKTMDTVPGMRFLFSHYGKRYGVRLDPIVKRVVVQPDSFDRILRVKPLIYHIIDDEAMIQELKKVIDEQVS